MDRYKESGEAPLLPEHEQRQPEDKEWAARAGSLLKAVLDARKAKPRKTKAGGRESQLDSARFTAGVVAFYEAVVNEPVPERMLKLVEEIKKQEHP